MLHASLAPDPRLAPWVESVWVQEEPAVSEPLAPTVLLPVVEAALVVEHGDPFELVGLGHGPDGRAERLPPVLLSGPRDRAARVRSLGRTGLVIVNFRPGAAAAFFRGAAAAANRFVALGELCAPAAVRELHERVCAASDVRARVAAVERFLLARRPVDECDARVGGAVERLLARGGRGAIDALAREVGLGRRQLARRFEDELGLAPKPFARVVRFQAALRRARAGERWAAVATAAGYHDQAHLVKECVALAGRTPRELLGGIEERAVGRAFNDADRPGAAATYL